MCNTSDVCEQIASNAAGSEGGPCYGNGTCNDGLVCNASDVCEQSTANAAGNEGGPCYGNGTCNDDLVCSPSDVCEQSTADAAGSAGGPCYGNGTCNDDLVCNASDVCEHAAGSAGGPCYGNGVCNDDLVCVNDVCEPGCAQGLADCNGDAGDGCEVDLSADDNNCSRCGMKCEEAEDCVAGNCLELMATEQPMPIDVEVDATHVYWLNQGSTDPFGNPAGDAGISRVALTGGNPELFVSGIGVAERMAQDESHIYWIDNGGWTPDHTTTINRKAKAGGDAQELVSLGAHWTTDVLVGETYIYWASPVTGVAVERMRKDGTGVRQAFYSGTESATTFAQDSANVYWIGPGFPEIKLIVGPKDGSTPTAVDLPMHDPPRNMTCDGTSLFWVADMMENCVVHSIDPDGSNYLSLSAGIDADETPMCMTERVETHGDYVYWHANLQRWDGSSFHHELRIIKTPKVPGESTTLIRFPVPESSWHAPGLAVVSSGVYVSFSGVAMNRDGFVVRLGP